MHPEQDQTKFQSARRVLTLVVLLFGVEAGFAVLIPFLLLPINDGLTVGTIIGCAYGVGFLVLPAFSEIIDSSGRWKLVVASALAMTLATVAYFYFGNGSSFWIAVSGAVLFGLGRTLMTSGVLTSVARLPQSRTLIQGMNGSAQRLGSAFGAGSIAALAAVISVRAATAVTLLACTLLMIVASMSHRHIRDLSQKEILRPSVRWSNYRTAFEKFFSSSRIRAASMLNLMLMFLALSGNTFVAVAMLMDHASNLALVGSSVISLVVARDAISVFVGPFFWVFSRIVSERVLLISVTLLMTMSLVIVGTVAIPAGDARWFIGAGVLQGVAISLGISSTNILATTIHREGQLLDAPGQGIISSLLPAAPAMFVGPILIGWTLSAMGYQVAFASLAMVFAISGYYMAKLATRST